MSYAAYSVLMFAGSLLAAIRLKERALYLVFLVAFTQNFVLAYLYTNGLAGKDFCRSIMLFKEFLLLELFVYAVLLFYRHFQGEWPRPIFILFLFSVYCVLRFAFGAVFFKDFSADGLRKLRMMCFPLQILTVAMVTSWLHPEFSKRFVRRMTCCLGVAGLIGVLLFLFPEADFWKQHVDIATFNMDVKGDEADSVIEEHGIPGTGAGREAFLFLSSFRAMGTFADPLAFGFSMAVPILLLTFYYQRSWLNILMLVISGAAIFFTFSRSSWIFVTIAFVCLLIQMRRYMLVATLATLGVGALLAWPPLAEFAASEYSFLSWTNPGSEHAEGIAWFYQRGFTDPGNILGKGMDDGVRKIAESGNAFLLEHFGLAAYLFWMWFLVSMYRYLKLQDSGRDRLVLVSQAMILGIFVVMHFSQYPFSFIGWIPIWYVFGLSVAGVSAVQTPMKPLADETQKLLTESGNA